MDSKRTKIKTHGGMEMRKHSMSQGLIESTYDLKDKIVKNGTIKHLESATFIEPLLFLKILLLPRSHYCLSLCSLFRYSSFQY